MQKMVKTGFRGERKENPHPVPLPRRGGIWRRKKGNVVTEKGSNDEGQMMGDERWGDEKVYGE